MRRRFNGCSTPLTFFFLCRWRDVCRTGDARPARRALRTYIFRTPMSGTCVDTLMSVEQVKKLSKRQFAPRVSDVLSRSRRKSTRRKHGEIARINASESEPFFAVVAANQILSPHPLFVLHNSNHSLGSFTFTSDRLDFSSLFFTHITHHIRTSKPAHIHLFP